MRVSPAWFAMAQPFGERAAHLLGFASASRPISRVQRTQSLSDGDACRIPRRPGPHSRPAAAAMFGARPA